MITIHCPFTGFAKENALYTSLYTMRMLYVAVTTKTGKKYLRLEEGTGDNLDADDFADGYMDYLNYYIADKPKDVLVDHDDKADGGMVMTEFMIFKADHGLLDFVEDVMYEEGMEPIETAVYFNSDDFIAAETIAENELMVSLYNGDYIYYKTKKGTAQEAYDEMQSVINTDNLSVKELVLRDADYKDINVQKG